MKNDLVEEFLALDIESTPPPNRRPVELAIVSNTRGLIFHSYFNPGYCTQDILAKKGLSDYLLQNASNFEDRVPEIVGHIRGHHIVSWHLDFDKEFFPDKLLCAKQTHCAMKRYDPYRGVYSLKYGNYRRTKLGDAMATCGIAYMRPGPHRAFSDAQAVLDIWLWMEENPIPRFQRATNSESKNLSLVR